jgi:hypothetical protein
MIQAIVTVISLFTILLTTSIIIAKGTDIKTQYDDKLRSLTDQVNNSQYSSSQVDQKNIDNINEVRKTYTSKEDIARNIDTRELNSARASTKDLKSLNITGEFVRTQKLNTDYLSANKVIAPSGVIGEFDANSLKANKATINQLNFDAAGKYSMNQKDNSLNINIPDNSKLSVKGNPAQISLGDKADIKFGSVFDFVNAMTIGIDNKDIVGLYNIGGSTMTMINGPLAVFDEEMPAMGVANKNNDYIVMGITPETNAIVSKGNKPLDIISQDYVRMKDAQLNNVKFSSKIDKNPAITTDKDNLLIYGETDSTGKRNVKINDKLVVGESYMIKNQIGTDQIISNKGISINNNDPGPLIEKNYGSLADRYGIGQFPGGTTKVYSADTGTLSLSQAKANGSFDDILTIKPDKNININSQKINLPDGAHINTSGRQNMSGDEYLYILNKKGAIISKDMGGTGSFTAQGSIQAGDDILGNLVYANKGFVINNNDPGPLIQKQYGNDVGNRYGMGQFPNGDMKVYTATNNKISLSQAKTDGKFDDVLTIYPNKTIDMNTSQINLPTNNNIYTKGRQRVLGDEYLYLLNKSGVVISKDEGGTGNLSVQGNVSGTQITGDQIIANKTITANNDVFLNNVKISKNWTGYPDGTTDKSEIANDIGGFKKLMIVGNKSGDGNTRKVGIWDQLDVHGNLCINNTCLTESELTNLKKNTTLQDQINVLNTAITNLQSKMNVTTPSIDSVILTSRHTSSINTLLPGKTLTLLFRGSRDGSSASAFHSKCDNKSPLFIVYKSNNYIATAYVSMPFKSINDYSAAPGSTCWLNNLDNGSSLSTSKFYNTNYPQYTFIDHYTYGPTLGYGQDLYCPGDYKNNNGGSSPYTFTGSGFTNSTLFGTSSFRLSDYEVFQVI